LILWCLDVWTKPHEKDQRGVRNKILSLINSVNCFKNFLYHIGSCYFFHDILSVWEHRFGFFNYVIQQSPLKIHNFDEDFLLINYISMVKHTWSVRATSLIPQCSFI